ncbi:P1 family peptidase [Nocardiopsis coralliicola]
MTDEPRTGPTNSLADAGLSVGHAQRVGDGWRTGTSVVLASEAGAVGGVDVRGAAPGTRETDLLDPRNLVERAHAVVLSGGSAFGLDAATGVVARLADAGRGIRMGGPGEVVPIVPAAVIFDLGRGGRFRATPGAGLGAEAHDAALALPAGAAPAQGSVGAGTGARVGGLAGGTGSASLVLSSGATVAAFAVANGAGSAVDPRTGAVYGAEDEVGGEFGGAPQPAAGELAAWSGPAPLSALAGGAANTTIGVIATDLLLTKAQAQKLAGVAHDGLARAVRPAHTMVDGDTVFALSTGERAPDFAEFQELLAAAAPTFARAIAHGVYAAAGAPGAPAYRDVFPSACAAR